MSLLRTSFRVARGRLLAASAAALLVACVADPITPPPVPEGAPAFARATSGPAVSGTLPASGDKGQTLDVHVYGSGFGAGATATWALRGVADPSKVRTNSTTVVSSTELIANITISSDATVAYWDVQVTLGGKTGVGTEAFEVTSAIAVGSGTAYSVDDGGDVAGLFAVAPTTIHGFVVSGTDGTFSDLGLRQARAISADGRFVVGSVGTPSDEQFASVWTRAAGGAWPATGTRLPDPTGMTSGGGVAFAIAAVPSANVVVATAVLLTPAATPVYWESADGTWTSPAQVLPIPAGYAATVNSTFGISATGDVAGQLNDVASGNSKPVVWHRVTGSYVADILPVPSGWPIGMLRAISPDGAIAVGNVRQSLKGKQVIAPAVWTRGAGGSYTVQLLPTLTGTYGADGKGFGVTVVGSQVRAVGTSPSPANGSVMAAVIWTWTVGASDFQVRNMGGLGVKTDVAAYGINTTGTVAVGSDGTNAIKWLLLP